MWIFPFALALLAAPPSSPIAVTGASLQVRLRTETRDDRFFVQTKWADRDIALEYRIRGATTLVHRRFRLQVELQDQRIPSTSDPRILDVSPGPDAACGVLAVEPRGCPPADVPPQALGVNPLYHSRPEAGLRLAGSLALPLSPSLTLRAGRFPVVAADGRLLGADEYREGYRPWGMSVQGDRWLAWAGTDEHNPRTGNRWLALARWKAVYPRALLEGGLIARREPSRPVFPGVYELSATPYFYLQNKWADAIVWEVLGALQAGQRSTARQSFTTGHNVGEDTDRGFGGVNVRGYSGERGTRSLLAPLFQTTLSVRLPLSRRPVLGVSYQTVSAGGDDNTDRRFVPFRHDMHRFFGAAGYFGERNARSYGAKLDVPVSRVWSASVAVWRVDVISPREGWYLENGELFAPDVWTLSRRGRAFGRHALNEWDAALHWAPPGEALGLTVAYSEIRHGGFFSSMFRQKPAFFAPPTQWLGVLASWKVGD